MKTGSRMNTPKARWIALGLAAGAAWTIFSLGKQAAEAARWERLRQSAAGVRKALVTGASSGIGEAYARALAARGYNLVLVARREERLNSQAAACAQQYGAQVEVLPADLSTEEGIRRVEQRLSAGDIDFLVNSAGYDVFGDFAQLDIDRLLELARCLALATVRLTHAALPGMLERRQGAVVNVSSIGAFTAKRKDAIYMASKAFVNRFSETLALELFGSGVRIQALCPGLTLTEFHDGPQFAPYRLKERVPRWAWMLPEQVVAASLQALGENRVVCVPGLGNQVIAVAAQCGLVGLLLRGLARFSPAAIQFHNPGLLNGRG